MEKKISINENAPTIKDWNFEQIKLDWTYFFLTNFSLKNTVGNIINGRF